VTEYVVRDADPVVVVVADDLLGERSVLLRTVGGFADVRMSTMLTLTPECALGLAYALIHAAEEVLQAAAKARG